MAGCEGDEVVCQIGDVNAQVADVKISGMVRDFGFKVVNENGEMMLEMCVQKEVTVCSTSFKNIDILNRTWTLKVKGEVAARWVTIVFQCVLYRVLCVNILRNAIDV